MRTLAVLLAATAFVPCAGARGLLVPVHRMLDAPAPPPSERLAWGEYVRIDRMERPAIAPSLLGTEVVMASPPSADAPAGRWTVALPAATRDAGWLLVAPGLQTNAGLTPLLARFVAPAASGPTIAIDGGDGAAQAGTRLLAVVRPVDALGARAVVGRPFVVPPGAMLTLGMGIDESAWLDDALPVEFRVAVVEGDRETIVHQAVLDPARRPEDRHWVDARIDLGAFAGRSAAVALRTAPGDATRAGTSLPVWSDPTVWAPRPTHVPNVILISLDTLRAKSVSAYGAARPTTPHLDELGEAGAIFDFAYTTAPHTFPAHLSAFTGLYVRGLAGVTPVTTLPRDVPTLPERLRAAGYETAAFTEDGFVIPRAGFRRGFASYHENTSPNLHEPLGQSAKTFRAAADWLATRRDRPTFLFVHTYEVHFPYTPVAPYDEAFASAADFGDDAIAVERLRYEQEARYLDDELRAFLDAVDGLGLGVRTLVVVMSDHGEEFGEHGGLRHGFQVHDETVHVPLMMRWPGVVPAGHRVATPVSLVDVAPTILDLVGARPLVGVDGESLVPLFGGGTLSEHRRAVFSETVSGFKASGIDLLSVAMPGIHCIYQTWKGHSACFDTAHDSEQRTPIVWEDSRVERAREEAIAYWNLRRAAPSVTVPDQLHRELSKDTDRERLEKLRSLGYVE